MAGRQAVIVAAGLALIAAAAGCAPASAPGGSPAPSDAPRPTGPPPAPLEVLCDENLVLTVSSDTAEASSAGVAIRVTSEAPAGAYLNYGYGGDEMPSTPATWVLTPPPGALELHCSTLEAEGEVVEVTVVDPYNYWSELTLADYGCEMGAMPGWAIDGGSGATPQEAIDDLLDNFSEPTALTRSVHAQTGYPDAESQDWILGTEEKTQVAAVVVRAGSGFEAYPDFLCVESPWPDPLPA